VSLLRRRVLIEHKWIACVLVDIRLVPAFHAQLKITSVGKWDFRLVRSTTFFLDYHQKHLGWVFILLKFITPLYGIDTNKKCRRKLFTTSSRGISYCLIWISSVICDLPYSHIVSAVFVSLYIQTTYLFLYFPVRPY